MRFKLVSFKWLLYFCIPYLLFFSETTLAEMFNCPSLGGDMVFTDKQCPDAVAKSNNHWVSVKEYNKIKKEQWNKTIEKKVSATDELEQRAITAHANIERSEVLFKQGQISAEEYRQVLLDAQKVLQANADKQRNVIEQTTKARKNLHENHRNFLREIDF